MNKFEFKKFKDWFFDQTETYIRNENNEQVPVKVPYYQLRQSDACIRECGLGRHYSYLKSHKYFTKYGNKNFIINGDYIEFDTPIDDNGNFYKSSDACHMFYDGGIQGYYDVHTVNGKLCRGKYHEVPKHTGNYKHIKIHYKKFCYPLSKSYQTLYWNI